MFYNSINVFIMGEFVVSSISMLITADRSALFTTTLVISGITVVVGVLLLLIFIFKLFGKIVPKIEVRSKKREAARAARKAERKKKRAAKKAAKMAAKQGVAPDEITQTDAPKIQTPVPVAPAPAVPYVEPGISGEVVAAIAAAVAVTEGGNAVIRSVKRKNVGGRNPWAHAANIDNTRPF